MYRCSVCKFECDSLVQHAKTEWHTYNLRRETIGLNSIRYEDFIAKQNDLLMKNTTELQKDYYCCQKVFKSVKTYENHLKSKKHVEKSKNIKDVQSERDEGLEEEMVVEYVEDDEELEEFVDDDESEISETTVEPLTNLNCFFCKHSFKTQEQNLEHMRKKHNFNLPYPEYISDLDGLIEYLISLIDEYHVCFQCNKQFDDRLGVKNHMLDLNHIQLYFNLESNGDDLADFYGELPKPVNKLGELTDADMQIEAVLDNGKRIGNRNMNVYFKQNLNGLSNTSQLAITSGVEKAQMSLIKCGKYGALAKATSSLTPQEKKYKTLEARYIQLRSSRYSNFQQHFRLQILM